MKDKLINENVKETLPKIHVRAKTGDGPAIRIKHKNGSVASYLRDSVPDRGDRPLHDSVVRIMRFLLKHKDKVFVVEEFPDQEFADALFRAFRVINSYKDYPQHIPLALMLEKEMIAHYYYNILELEIALNYAAPAPAPAVKEDNNLLKACPGAGGKSNTHYEGKGGVNLKEFMNAFATDEEVYGFRKWNANKYIIRAGLKVEPGLTPLQSKIKDLKKARDYLDDMILTAEKELKDSCV